MCLDRPDHIARGKGPIDPERAEDREVDPETDCYGRDFIPAEFELLFTARDWAQAALKLGDLNEEIGGESSDAQAAYAECMVRDWANYYEHAWIDGVLHIYGEAD